MHQHLRVVAHLLQVAEHREHRTSSTEAVLVRLDAREPSIDRCLIQARLQLAVVLLDADRRQVELHFRLVLRTAQDERAHDCAQPLERCLVLLDLDRLREDPVEPLARAEQARVEDVHDRPQLVQPVLDRRARHRDATTRRQHAQRTRALRLRVLHVLRLVHQQSVPLDLREDIHVARRDVIRRDDDVHLAHLAQQLVVREPIAPVMQMHAQLRREAMHLRDPLPRDAHRAHH